MEHLSLRKKSFGIIAAMAFVISGCLPSDVPRSSQNYSTNPEGESTSGAGAGVTTSGSTTGTSIPPKVEIRHLIEPNLSTDPNYSSGTGYAGGGSYVRKLTLPKNFQGRMYVAGINIGTLASRHVKVRFKFGVDREPITIPAVVAQAPGITPQTNIHVLVMDMRSEPFRNLRLTYDLFDYNEYANDQTPVQDNRNNGLYCRGLRLEDDSSFEGSGYCDGADEKCLYSYAKIVDQGLIKEVVGSPTTYVPLEPTLPQVRSVTGSSYYDDALVQHLKKPLSDNMLGPFKISEYPGPPVSIIDFLQNPAPATVALKWTAASINGSNYYYRGPYRLVNTAGWHLKASDLVGDFKLFKKFRPYPSTPAIAIPERSTVYFGSYMFPLATQLDLQAGVAHLSSSDWKSVRSPTSLSVAGKTQWMDGVNARAQSKNSDLEHVGSCTVSSSIEILAKDDNDVEYVVSLANDVKLQLVRPIVHYVDENDNGSDVLYSNFKTCSSSATCGGSECCFNSRCWDEKLVSQCFDASATQGNRVVGDSCLTDMDCSSLCCNRTSGLCAPHNTISSPAVLCNKPVGDFCISKEWCQKSPIVKCLIVKTGVDSLGAVTCRQQCYTTLENGDCKSGVCTPPVQDTPATFDPNAANACAGAVPPPSF